MLTFLLNNIMSTVTKKAKSATVKKTNAPAKAPTKSTAKKPAVADKAPKPTAPKASAPAKKRTRNSNPLYASVKLGVIKKLVDDNDDALVTVSRNFILALKKEKLEAAALKSLGI